MSSDPGNAVALGEGIRLGQTRERLCAVERVWGVLRRFDASTAVIATFGPLLTRAKQHYGPRCQSFLLVEREGDALLSVADRQLVEGKALCLYVIPSRSVLDPLGLRDLIVALRRAGVISGFYVDTAVMGEALTLPGSPDLVELRMDDISAVLDRLGDTSSEEVFLRAVKMIQTGDPGFALMSDYPQYLHPLVRPVPGDFVFEGGPSNGATTLQFARLVGDGGRVFAFEPLSAAAAASVAATRHLGNVVVDRLGLWSKKAAMHIEDRGAGSHVVPHPTGTSERCECIDLDSYIVERGIRRCDLLKLDIEGAEEECLQGATRTIRELRPKLQISVYHQPSHCIDIPQRLMRECAGYRFFMGHHMPWYWETVLYGLPP